MKQPDFKTLLKACRNYERKAQRQMVDLLAPFLSSVCRRYESVHWETPDLVQESLIQIFNHIEDSEPEEKMFMGWCKRVAVNVCLGKFRKKQIPLEHLDAQVAASFSFSPEVFAIMGAEEIMQILDFLPESQRLVFNLHVLDGYSHAEIGDMLHIKESHSRTLLVRARATLQALVHSTETTAL